MKTYHGSHQGNRFIVSDSYDYGACVCGKEEIQLISVWFDRPVTVRTFNNKTRTGTLFQFGCECINSFTIDGEAENPIVQSKDEAYRQAQQRKHDFFSVVQAVHKKEECCP